MRVCEQLLHAVIHGHEHVLVAYLPEDSECGEHLQVVLGLQIPLDRADHQDHHVRVLLDEQGTREVPDALHQQVLALR